MTNVTKKLASAVGLTVLSRHRWEDICDQQCKMLVMLKEQSADRLFESTYPAECIIFSKDRPTQLYALLASYFEKVRHPVPVHILYRASTTRYDLAYQEVMRLFAKRSVTFHAECVFYDDMIRLLEGVKAPRVFFLVDDVLFTESVDMDDFSSFDADRFIPSMRLGKNLTRCYTGNCSQPLPPFKNGVLENDKVCWRWRDGVFDWGYPLSVDGHLFSTIEITLIAKVSRFVGPNTFEGVLQNFSGCFLDRYGLCYTKSRIINIPCNKVQIENSNTYGDIDQEFLLKKWEAGYQIDFRKFYGFVNQSAHQNVDFTLVPRVDAEKLEHKTKIANVKRNSLESSFKKIAVKMFDRWRGMTNDQCREKWVKEKLEEIPAGKRLLDVGAGEQRYRRYCGHLDYISQDFGKYDGSGDSKGLQTGVWNYQKTDIVSDITNIPEPDASFDVIMCTEVLEHLPAPIDALRELSRLIRLGGDLILTAPFASLTHFSPYHYYSGFNRNFYNTWLKKFGFEIVELVPNGNFFGFVMQELLRLRRITRQFTKTKRLRLSEYFALVLMLCALRRFSRNDTGSSELLCYGYMVKAKKVRI